MADSQITDLTELAENPANNDFFIVRDTSTSTDKKIQFSNLTKDLTQRVTDLENAQQNNYYGMIIRQPTANPATRVEYTGINKNYTAMSMGSGGAISKGSWSSMPTIAKNHPAILSLPGSSAKATFQYWLDDNDYTKKASDGSLHGLFSNSANASSYGAFSWFEPIYMRIVASGTDLDVRFAYEKIDNDYIEVCPENCGVWLPMFYSHANYSGKATSFPNLSCLGSGSTDTQKSRIDAAASNAFFFGGKLALAIYLLGCMWFKTTNSDAWGTGNRSGYNANDTTTYGTKVNPIVGGGQFYATSDNTSANKFLHSIVLNTYDVWLRDPYSLTVNGEFKLSPNYTYDLTGNTYISGGTAPVAGYPTTYRTVDKFGMVPSAVGGSSSTYYCDYFWINPDITSIGLRFGGCSHGAYAGGSAWIASDAAGYSYWSLGFALSLKQEI